jgi:2-dehydropantoate 2-reductase
MSAPKQIAVIGAGAIGAALAARLALAGHTVSVVARGEHLAAMQHTGITLREKGVEQVAQVRAVGQVGELPPQDVVFITLKAHQIMPLLADVAKVCHEQTVVLPAINGIPWWYFHADTSPYGADATHGQTIPCLDPQGRGLTDLNPKHLLGCVVHASAEVVAPGVVLSNGQHRYRIGEPSHTLSPRVEALASLMREAGLEPTATARIRDEIWMKLVGNTSYNPVGALTRARMDQINRNDGLVQLIRDVMGEVQALARAYGCDPLVSVEERIAIAKGIGPVKVSTLQDLERGRPLEVDGILNAPIELGQRAGVPMPFTRALAALLGELNRRLVLGED